MDLLKKIKIELWVLCLAGVLLFIGLIGFGSLVRHGILAPVSRLPILSSAALFIAEIPVNLKKIIFVNDLQILEQRFPIEEIPVNLKKIISVSDLQTTEQQFPNVSGFQKYPLDKETYLLEFQGKPLEEETYLLLSRYDGDIERSVVALVDLRSFEVKKMWHPDIDQINALVDTSLPEFEDLERDNNAGRYMMAHPFLTEDGGLIFQGMGSPLVKIDKNSQLVWQNQEDNFHHSIEQDHEGNFWVPSHLYPYQVDKKYVGSEHGTYLDDAITKVSADGEILFQKSVTNIFIENNLEFWLFQMKNFSSDPIHLNDIQPVLTDSPHWKQGDVFMSLPILAMIILYRPSTNKIIWVGGQGHVSMHHDVNILDDHRISIFNNNTKNFFDGVKVDGSNEVVIYDFKTDSYSKYLNESLKQYDVRTGSEGRSQILDNDDLFIEEQNYGRILYFNKDESLQWQYVNRADDGKVNFVKWSRILFTPEDINKIRKILETES